MALSPFASKPVARTFRDHPRLEKTERRQPGTGRIQGRRDRHQLPEPTDGRGFLHKWKMGRASYYVNLPLYRILANLSESAATEGVSHPGRFDTIFTLAAVFCA
jgi:hypothetical protein